MTFSSDFAQKLASSAGIIDLMADLGEALNVNPEMLFLGGGNPAKIDAFEAIISEHLQTIATDAEALHRLLGIYQSPQGSEALIAELVQYFTALGWPVSHEHICITNGSQSAFFMLFNLLAGPAAGATTKTIHLPVLPEYLGYADQGMADAMFTGTLPIIEKIGEHGFKYHCDFNNLHIDKHTAALCVSRPTNPSGNVLTDDEMQRLGELADQHDIPLIVDCAYGDPFPGVIYESASAEWQPNRVFVLSLSKLGLPGARTGIVIGDPELIQRLVNVNTVTSLASGNFGPALMTSLLQAKQLTSICQDIVHPFYQRKRDFALAQVAEQLNGLEYRVHRADGAFFLWLWFPGLPISSTELYQRLKQHNVLVMDGTHFFFELDAGWPHAHECIRITYCAEDAVLARAIKILANELRALNTAC